VFVAPRLLGGRASRIAVAGQGVESLSQALHLEETRVEMIGGDVLIHGTVKPSGDQNR
jgi:riboflavin biosynthesis pyrimidine reductase